MIGGTAPLAVGYLVLASRLDKVPQPPGERDPEALAPRRRSPGGRALRRRAARGRADRALPRRLRGARARRPGDDRAQRQRPRGPGRVVAAPAPARARRRAHPELEQPRALRDRDAAARGHRDHLRRRDARAPARLAGSDRRGAGRRRPRRVGRGDARHASRRLPLPRRLVGRAQGRPGRRGRLPAHEFHAQRSLPRLRRGVRRRSALAGRQRRPRLGPRHGALGAGPDRALAEAPARSDRARLVRGAARNERRALRALPHAASRPTTRSRRSGRGSCSCARARPAPTPVAFARAGLRVFRPPSSSRRRRARPASRRPSRPRRSGDALPDLR